MRLLPFVFLQFTLERLSAIRLALTAGRGCLFSWFSHIFFCSPCPPVNSNPRFRNTGSKNPSSYINPFFTFLLMSFCAHNCCAYPDKSFFCTPIGIYGKLSVEYQRLPLRIFLENQDCIVLGLPLPHWVPYQFASVFLFLHPHYLLNSFIFFS